MQDADGAASTTTLTITISGTNDGPVITGTTSGEVQEDVTLSVSGQLTPGDPDQGAQAAWSVVDGIAAHSVNYQFAIDNLTVVKNGALLFEDTFGDNNAPPLAPNFADYGPNADATFIESGGLVIMDGTVAGAAVGVGTSDPFVGHFATVRTGINPAGALTLGSDDDFTVEGQFQLGPFNQIDFREAYGIRLSDRLVDATGTPTKLGDDVIELVVRHGPGGVVVQLVEFDFVADRVHGHRYLPARSGPRRRPDCVAARARREHSRTGDCFVRCHPYNDALLAHFCEYRTDLRHRDAGQHRRGHGR